MPVVHPHRKVLISGANGYIAMWVARELLEQGYSVRGTVRSAAKGVHPRRQFAKYGEQFEIVVIEDMTKEGAFDEAVKGVDAIVHTASPAHLNARHPEELIEPAVKGTVGILQSTLKHGTSVKRVVITSTASAVVHDEPTPTTFTEKDWNLQCLEIVKEEGENADSDIKYRASKTLAEQAAWRFIEEHKEEISWDMTVINPPCPTIHEVTGPSSLNVSTKLFYDHVVNGLNPKIAGNKLHLTGGNWVDVRDVGLAHRLALEKPDAGNERIIVSAGVFKWQDFGQYLGG
ncbi:hypothetical protein ID866_3010 [Astraeus odoratus]|nr:hypothetical protein ID866_3010 [Astraeus odoratus]